MIRRTTPLSGSYCPGPLRKGARNVGRTGRASVARAASFMLLADSRASFEIEGERPPAPGWSAGAAPSFRPANSRSLSTKSCGFSAS